MSELTDQQQLAIQHEKGPAIVIAGPGAGKTFVIVERVKRLITVCGADPKSILVTTFTEKAANELKIRLATSIGKSAELIHISTIHSFCKAMLEKYFTHHDYGAEISVLDDEGQKLFIDTNKVKWGIFSWSEGRPTPAKKSFDYIRDVKALYDTLTENNIDVATMLEDLHKRAMLAAGDEEILKGYLRYQESLESEKLMDFSLLQTKFYNLITNNEEILEDIRNNFAYILVDEYQDTNPVQDRIFRTIINKEENLFVVGDENQSIYGFRGASIRNFKLFLSRYEKAKSYLLNVNFRSTQSLVSFSNEIFEEGVKKELEARRREGEKVRLIYGASSDDTAKKAISLLKKLKSDGIITSYGDVAFLFRSLKSHAKEYVKYLEKEKIPYITYGDGHFLKREEIQTFLYLLSYVTQELYIENIFSEWANWWRKDIFCNEIIGLSRETKETLGNGEFDLYSLQDEEDFARAGFTNHQDIQNLLRINRLKHEIARENETFGDAERGRNSLLRAFYKLLNYTGYFERLLEGDHEEELLNLGRLTDLIDKFVERTKREDVKGFLWYVYNNAKSFDQLKIENGETVKLMTVHAAKGMEFPVVFLCCLNEGRFPLRYWGKYIVKIPPEYLESGGIDDEEEFLQEERRLFYVGTTRAQDNLVFTASEKHISNRWKLSRFLEGIPRELMSDNEFKLATEKHYEHKKEVPNLNYSAINTFIDCPLRYHLVYDFGFVTPASPQQKYGVFVHNTLQRIHERIRRNEEISPTEFKEIVDTYWQNLPVTRKRNKQLREGLVKHLIKYYLQAKENYREIIAIEESFSHIDNNMIIRGKVDLVVRDKNDDVMLVDFKARTKKGIEETNVGKQLQIYQHCLDTEYPINKLIAYTFEDNAPVEFKESEESVQEYLQDMSAKMRGENFPKQKNSFCRHCQFKFYCWGGEE